MTGKLVGRESMHDTVVSVYLKLIVNFTAESISSEIFSCKTANLRPHTLDKCFTISSISSQAVEAHTFNPSTRETEAGGYL